MKKALILISILLILFFSLSAVSADDSDVNQTFDVIQTAVDEANESDVILLEGNYCGLANPITVEKPVTIEGAANGALLDGQSKSQIFQINSQNVTLKNLVFTNGNPKTLSGQDFGGAVQISADNVKIINCSFIKNTARYGGAVYSTGNNISVTECIFQSNTVDYTGAAVELDGDDCYVANCIFESNIGGHAGGDVAWVGANGVLENSEFIFSAAKSRASQFGGAVVWMGANGRLSKSTFDSYYAKKYGSAVYWKGANGTLNYNIFKNTENTYWGNPDYADDNYWGFNIDSSDDFASKNLIYFNGNYTSAKRWVNIQFSGDYINFTSSSGELREALPDYQYNSTVKITNNTFKIKKQSKLTSSNLITYCLYDGKYLKVTLSDVNGKKLTSRYVYLNLNGKTLSSKTDSRGVASFRISLKAAKTYSASISFKGDDDFKSTSKTVKITVKKQKPVLTIKTRTLKVKSKSKVVKVQFKNQFKKVVANVKVKITINKKTYVAKTNSKGIASFKVALKAKKTYKITAKFSGNSYYSKVTKTSSIRLK